MLAHFEKIVSFATHPYPFLPKVMGKSIIPKSLSDFFWETRVRFGSLKYNHTHGEVAMLQQAREVKRSRWRDNLLNRRRDEY